MVDKFLGDVLRSRDALDELLGEVRSLEERLVDVISLYRCDDEIADRSKSPDLVRKLLQLNRQFALKSTQAAFIYHLYAGLTARTNIASADLLPEIQAFGRIREKLQHDNSYIGGRKTRRLLERRIGRRVSAQSIAQHLNGVPRIGDHIRTLVATHRLVPFTEQRGPLLDRLALIFEDPLLAEKLAKESSKAIDHLADTGALHRAINGSQLPQHLRNKYMDSLATVQDRFVRSTRFFVTMQQAIAQSSHRIVVLLEVCGSKSFVEKDLQRRAEDAVVEAVSAPQFVPGYLAKTRSQQERNQRLDELKSKLSEAGFDPASVLSID